MDKEEDRERRCRCCRCSRQPLIREAPVQAVTGSVGWLDVLPAQRFHFYETSRQPMAERYEEMLEYWRLCETDSLTHADINHLLDISGRPKPATTDYAVSGT